MYVTKRPSPPRAEHLRHTPVPADDQSREDWRAGGGEEGPKPHQMLKETQRCHLLTGLLALNHPSFLPSFRPQASPRVMCLKYRWAHLVLKLHSVPYSFGSQLLFYFQTILLAGLTSKAMPGAQASLPLITCLEKPHTFFHFFSAFVSAIDSADLWS